MFANTISPCITTAKVEESRDFYVKHFGAKVTFDCGWYVNLQFGKESSSLQFMAPPARTANMQPRWTGIQLLCRRC